MQDTVITREVQNGYLICKNISVCHLVGCLVENEIHISCHVIVYVTEIGEGELEMKIGCYCLSTSKCVIHGPHSCFISFPSH